MLKNHKYFILLLSVFLIVGCNKKEFAGGEIIVASEGFSVLENLTASDYTPDFDAGAIHFTAKFSEKVTAKLVINGLESGASKNITLTETDELSIDNALWSGTHDDLYFFRTGEQVVATLSFYGTEIIQIDTLIIDQSLSYNNDSHIPLQGGDFENDADGSGPIKYPDWVLYGPGDFLIESQVLTSEIIQVQGEQSFRMAANASANGYQGGMDNEVAVWYGQIIHGPGTIIPEFLPLPADPDSVYFAIYLYGTGEAADKIVIEFAEADGDNETFVPGQCDGVQVIQPLDHVGWKLFSYKYSTLPFSSYAPGGGNGNKIHEPDRIVRVSFSLEITETAPRYGEAISDFSIFTIGHVFNPSKF